MKKVLLVEDNEDTARVLEKAINILGFEIRVANDGYTAINMANYYLPDYVLLDIGMPIIDGYEVARQLRKNPYCKDCQIIALTGYGGEEDKERCLKAGFDKHITKPVGLEELKQVLK